MNHKADNKGNDGSWSWAYLIPITALMIPIVAIGNVNVTEILTGTMAAIVIAIGASTVAGRYLLGYRHELRMAEFEAQRELTALEARQLTEAQRLLDLDNRLDELKSQPKATLSAEA